MINVFSVSWWERLGPSLWGKCSLLGKACYFILLEQTNEQYVFNNRQWYAFIFLLKLLAKLFRSRAAEIGKFEVVFKDGVRSDGCALNCVTVSGFV